MIAAGQGGRILLFTSQGAFTGGFHGSVPYSMTKAAVTALVKSLAREGAPHGVTVNAIAPGGADTPMLREGMTPAALTNFQSGIPMGRIATPNEIAAPAAFLLSRWAAYITGTTLHVNGGQFIP
jgi:NAD(P)-dependent dehydrogenase (short-subunit alcohol dehydrogenase family)